MKTIILVLSFAFYSLYASAQQSQILTDTSKGLSTATRAILHMDFTTSGLFWIEFNNGCIINLKTELNINTRKSEFTNSQNMLLCLDYIDKKGFKYVGLFYQFHGSAGLQATHSIMERK